MQGIFNFGIVQEIRIKRITDNEVRGKEKNLQVRENLTQGLDEKRLPK